MASETSSSPTSSPTVAAPVAARWPALAGRLTEQVCLPASIVLTILLSLYQLGGRKFDIWTPLSMSGDALLHLLVTNRLLTGHGYYFDATLGFPFGASFYDFPGSDGLSLGFLMLVGKLSASPFFAVNAYYLLSFPLATLSFAVVARRLGIGALAASVGGLLFAFLPFHFLRLGHLYYTWYFVVPVYVWYGWRIFTLAPGEAVFTRARHAWLAALVLVAIASAGVYYAVFGMILLMAAGVMGAAQGRHWRRAGWGLAACAIVAAAVLANTAPNIAYRHAHGPNLAVADRSAQEADIYGLKIAQLLLPSPIHRDSQFQAVNATYSQTFPLVNENATSSLGLVGSLGFLGLLAYLLAGRRDTALPPRALYLSATMLVLFLVATIGGFGSLFALFVSPLIRGWNRVSVFIACLSLLGAALALGAVAARLAPRRWGGAVAAALLAAVLGFGLRDELGVRCDGACALGIQASHTRQQQFFDKVQQAVPPGAAIYNLPFMEFPETPPKFALEPYALVEGSLYTHGLRWSYGAMKGRDRGDEIFRALQSRPMAEQLQAVGRLGYSAVLVDRRGYEDKGAAVEAALAASGQALLAVEQDFRALYLIRR